MANRKRSLRAARATLAASGYVAMGPHVFDVEAARCRYCGLTREQIDDQGEHKTCVRRALDRMAERTPLRLTAEDEQIMREDWGLDPHQLPQVRIYQQLLWSERKNRELQQKINELQEGQRQVDEGTVTAMTPAAPPRKPLAQIIIETLLAHEETRRD